MLLYVCRECGVKDNAEKFPDRIDRRRICASCDAQIEDRVLRSSIKPNRRKPGSSEAQYTGDHEIIAY